MPAAPKLLGLEVIRFTCAMAVLVWHYHHFAMIGDGAAMTRPHAPLGTLLWPFYHFGLFGVQIFWCISGFIFYWKYADAIAERRIEPRTLFLAAFLAALSASFRDLADRRRAPADLRRARRAAVRVHGQWRRQFPAPARALPTNGPGRVR